MGAQSEVNIRPLVLEPTRRGERFRVVGLGAEEEVEIAVIDRGAVVIHHRADHRVLLPHGDENRGERLEAMLRLRRVSLRGEAGGDPNHVDQQIIEAAKENPSRYREKGGP